MYDQLNHENQEYEMSNSKIRITSDIFLMIMLIAWTILNIFQGALTDLSADEAYYYILSQYPSWGYFDHPPMNMWLISISTFLFGNSELGIRLLTILLQPIYLYLFWKTIKTDKSHMRSALTYFLLSFSMPMLQVWGWVSVPDASLMMFSILLLWTYKRFIDRGKLLDAILMGVSVALLGYSKYHGVLFVALLVLSNWRLFISWKFWVGMIVAALMYLPHIFWQYSNDWVSFSYHLSGRTNGFEWGNFWIYILNLLTTFNPFLIIIIIAFAVKRSLPSTDAVGKAMKFIMWGFVIFFLISVRNVHVQAQWIILVSFPIIYFIFIASETRPHLKHYVNNVGVWMLVIFISARIFLMISPEGIIEFDNMCSKKPYRAFAEKLGSIPFIGNSNYQFSSKLAYYGNIHTYGKPSLDCRSSHYQFIDMEEYFKGKTVAVEICQYAKDRNGKGINFSDTLVTKTIERKVVNENPRRYVKGPVYDTDIITRNYHYDTVVGYEIVWDTIQNYLPTEKVAINVTGFPSKIHSADLVIVTLEVTNPYDYDIPIEGPFSYKLYMNVKYGRFSSVQFPVGWTGDQKILPAKSTYKFSKEIRFPKDIPSGVGEYCFTVQRLPFGSWKNSERHQITIYNANNSEREDKHLLLKPYK